VHEYIINNNGKGKGKSKGHQFV